LYGGNFVLHGLSASHTAWLTMAGALLGWLGAQISVSIHLRRIG
jgi:cell division transport system permease protein